MTSPRLGLLLALATLALDQASKLHLLFGYRIQEQGGFTLGPVLDIVEVWNRGISYGMFQQSSDIGRWALVALSLAACAGFAVWLRRGPGRLVAASLGLLIGGALGNAVDRAAYGAVFDFIHLHAGGWSWYVFNVADAAIVAGVAGLLYDAVLGGGRNAAAPKGAQSLAPQPEPDGARAAKAPQSRLHNEASA